MLIAFTEQQLKHSLSRGNTGGDGWILLLAFIGLIVAIVVVQAIVKWIRRKKAERFHRRCEAIDRKLMSVLSSEFPQYDYNRLKSEIIGVCSGIYKCPRCGGIMERNIGMYEPMKCTRNSCRYPNYGDRPLRIQELKDIEKDKITKAQKYLDCLLK